MNSITQLAFLGGWELVLILSFVLVLIGLRKIPEFKDGLRQGLKEFLRASDEVGSEIGESSAASFGKPVADALTNSNQTHGLQDPPRYRRNWIACK